LRWCRGNRGMRIARTTAALSGSSGARREGGRSKRDACSAELNRLGCAVARPGRSSGRTSSPGRAILYRLEPAIRSRLRKALMLRDETRLTAIQA
jgi:hypothetical protein